MCAGGDGDSAAATHLPHFFHTPDTLVSGALYSFLDTSSFVLSSPHSFHTSLHTPGTLISGALYSFLNTNNVLVGFAACFWVSSAFVAASGVKCDFGEVLLPASGSLQPSRRPSWRRQVWALGRCEV